jgi:excisionase family DNA binding protein
MTQKADDFRGGKSPYLTVNEMAAHLKVSKMTVYRLVHSGTLDSIQVERSIRVHEDVFGTYLTSIGYRR